MEFNRLDGSTEKLEMEEGDMILDAMLDAGLDPTHDCKMGVCMTCPARVVCCLVPPRSLNITAHNVQF